MEDYWFVYPITLGVITQSSSRRIFGLNEFIPRYLERWMDYSKLSKVL